MEKVFTFQAWWNGHERQCSSIKEVSPGENSPSSSIGIVHEYETHEEAESARDEELSKND